MKIAPIMKALSATGSFESLLVHTGQHYDENMSKVFFNDLEIPKPDVNLEVGPGSHALQTAEIMKRFEPIVVDFAPRYVLVVGDVNSTIACGLTAVKLGVNLIHVEAGLRSGERSMPEEINRILTDSISDLLFCTEQSGVDNLLKEGIAEQKIHLVGNVMIDTLLHNLRKSESSKILDELRSRGWLDGDAFAVLTMHRPKNVDDSRAFGRILDALEVIQNELPVVFPIHPRTRKNLCQAGLEDRLEEMRNLYLLEPVGYLDFLRLISSARVVLTDSGGIQEETTILKVPCITLRENTERPITVEMGTNQVVGTDTQRIIRAYRDAMSQGCSTARTPPFWDGHAAERIAGILLESKSRARI